MSGEFVSDEKFLNNLNIGLISTRDYIINYVKILSDSGIHKQNANRYLEPFQHIKLICTGTEWENFFKLRCHPDAQPEIQSLAENIRQAMSESKPKYLEPGQWHIPFEEFMPEDELKNINKENLGKFEKINSDIESLKLKVSVARCARISYNNFETNSIDVRKDIDLYNRLLVQEPLHASPAEHQAKVPTEQELEHFHSRYLVHEVGKFTYHRGKYISNLNGWIQLRKLIENKESFN